MTEKEGVSQIFIQENFPHIDPEVVHFPISNKIWPLCNLKLEGNCQDIALIPSESSEGVKNYHWESEPKIKSCSECRFHKEECFKCEIV